MTNTYFVSYIFCDEFNPLASSLRNRSFRVQFAYGGLVNDDNRKKSEGNQVVNNFLRELAPYQCLNALLH